MSSPKNTGLIAGIIAVAVLFFVGLVWLVMRIPADPSSRNAGQPEQVTFNDEGAPSIGPSDAKVVVRLFSDFQCPACKFAEPPVKATIEAYKDRVRFLWKDFPLEQMHPNSRAAAEAARCAVDQGKFWEYHDRLYSKQDDWAKLSNPNAKLAEEGEAIGLNAATLSSCLQARAHDNLVARDLAEGLSNSVDRTPTFFINNRRYFAMSEEEWKKAIDAALKEAGSSK